MAIQKVSIEEGCISCSLCMDIAPDVFDVPDGEDCTIRPCAADHFRSKAEDILLAAADCPVEVIAVEEGSGAGEAANPTDGKNPAASE